MAIIKHPDASAALIKYREKYTSADDQVEASLKKFAAQLTMLATMANAASAEGQLIANINETADLAENADNQAWQVLKAEANLAKAALDERVVSYNDAVEPLEALRTST